jgi:hypothetical protein
MKKHIRTLLWIAISLALINIIWWIYNTILYTDIPEWFTKPDIYESYVHLIFIGLLVSFFSHFMIGLSLILFLRNSKRILIARTLLLVLWVVSFIALFYHWGYLCDILKEYPKGWEITHELSTIRKAQALQGMFFLCSAIYFSILRKPDNELVSTPSICGEHIFTALNIVGIVCGLLGLLVVYGYSTIHMRPLYRWEMIPYAFVLLPYIIMLLGWSIRLFKDKRLGAYDEKQKVDIYKAGFITLLTTIPLAILLIIHGFLQKNPTKSDIYSLGTINVLWLPFYLFMAMIVFSAIALYNYRKN